jgi:hypothetical protein
MHCVFCGAKQAGDAPAKTMMGYAGMADDVLAAAKAAKEQAGGDAPQAPAPHVPVGEPPPPQPAPVANPDPYGTTQPVDPIAPQYQQPPGPPPAQPAPQAPQYQQPQAPQYQQPQAPQYQQPGAAPPYGGGPQHHSQPQRPQRPEMPPYLASETGTRMNQPVEPWADQLRGLCNVFGIMCIIAFVAPWIVVGGRMGWSWDFFDAPETWAKMLPLFILLTGGAATAIAHMKVTTSVRGAVAAAAGLLPIVILAALAFNAQALAGRGGGGSGDFDWRVFAQMIGLVAISAGLLVRSKYPGAQLGRFVVTGAAVLILLAYLIPAHGVVPLSAAFKMLTNAPGAFKLLALYSLGPFFLAVCAMIVWAPPTTTAGATLLAWCGMIYLPVGLPLAVLAAAGDELGQSFRMLFVWYHIPVTLLAWFVLASFGMATVMGKQLEHN